MGDVRNKVGNQREMCRRVGDSIQKAVAAVHG